MGDLNDSVMANIHKEMAMKVVTIIVGPLFIEGLGDDELNQFDGTILACRQNSLYIIASSEFRDKIGTDVIRVKFPNGSLITLNEDDFDRGEVDNGLIGIKCSNATPELLKSIDICESNIQEQQMVYTYSHNIKAKLLTHGSVMLVENESFDHNCSAFIRTHLGAPVVNKDGQLIGICHTYKGYLSSYNMREIAAKIEYSQGNNFVSKSALSQRLRNGA